MDSLAAHADARHDHDFMKRLYAWAAWLALLVGTTAAHGDGGTMLFHQDAGAFTITLFAAAQPLTTGVADLSVMVQDRQSGDVLLDPVVDLTATREAGGAAQRAIRLAAGHGNRLLQSASLPLAQPGKWQLIVRVHRGHDDAQVQTDVMVQPNTSRAALVWFYVLLPVAVVLLFLLHQALKQKQMRRSLRHS
jgi:hypothetical protein